MKKLAVILNTLISLLILSSCSSSTTTVSTPTPTPCLITAEQILQALKNKGLPITNSIIYTEENDQNSLLGRPNQYISKASFVDGRYLEDFNYESKDKDFNAAEFGYQYTIETFCNKDDMQKRLDYLISLTKLDGYAKLKQYIYNTDTVILRVSYALTPTQAKEYENAFLSIAK